MTDAELFASAIRILDEPGQLPTTPYDPGSHWCCASLSRVANHANHFRRNEARRPMPRVLVGHVNDPRLNAFAFAHPDQGRSELFIAVNGGASIVIEQLFCRLLSEPELLTWIGNAAAETPGPRFPVVTDAQLLVDQFSKAGVNPFDRRPKCPLRSKAILLFSVLAMEYLLQHELCHIQAGHVAYVPRLIGRPVIQEAYATTAKPSVAVQLQALEMEADAFAACRTLHAAFDLCNDQESFPIDLVPDVDTALFFSQFAMYCVWRLFGDKLPNADWKSLDHPPIRIRQHLISDMLLRVFKSRVGEGGDDRFGTQFIRSGSEAELGFAKIQGCDVEMEGSMQVFSANSQKHIVELKEAWKSMEADLARESY